MFYYILYYFILFYHRPRRSQPINGLPPFAWTMCLSNGGTMIEAREQQAQNVLNEATAQSLCQQEEKAMRVAAYFAKQDSPKPGRIGRNKGEF